jgi:ABC-2 type transport system permease protein
VYLSSLTQQPTVAAVTTFGLLLLLWIIDKGATAADDGSGVLAWLSMLTHYDPLLKGLFNSMDVSYYLLVIILFTGFTIRRLDSMRLQN